MKQKLWTKWGLAAGFMLCAGQASAEGWNWLPVTDADYRPEPVLSLIGGYFGPDAEGADSAQYLGVELMMNCIMLQPPTNRIRTHVSYMTYDEKDLEVYTVELSPHYMIEVAPKFELGAGPGLGYVNVQGTAQDTGLFGLSVGASAAYYGFGKVFLGAEARYQITDDKDIGGGEEGLDNWRAGIKVGVAF